MDRAFSVAAEKVGGTALGFVSVVTVTGRWGALPRRRGPGRSAVVIDRANEANDGNVGIADLVDEVAHVIGEVADPNIEVRNVIDGIANVCAQVRDLAREVADINVEVRNVIDGVNDLIRDVVNLMGETKTGTSRSWRIIKRVCGGVEPSAAALPTSGLSGFPAWPQ